MQLPASLSHKREWTLVGPMGPEVSGKLLTHSLLCVDGGAHFCNKMDIWVGDGDSSTIAVQCDHVFNFPPEKAISDFALALTFFENSGPVILHCWGFLGGRPDHELFNFGAVLNFLENSPASEVYFYHGHGKIALKCLGSGEWKMNHQGIFSVACIKKTMIRIQGSCQYPLDNETEIGPLSSLGLSNIAYGQFTLYNQGPVMILFPEIN